MAAGRSGGLVDPQQPADAALGAGPQGQQGGDGAGPDEQGAGPDEQGAGPDEQGAGHVGGVVGSDGDPTQRDQPGGAGGGQAQAAGQE